MPRSSTFTVRFNDEAVPSTGKPLTIYRVERTDGASLWLVPELPGPSGWAKAGDVVAVEEAVDFFSREIRLRPHDAFLHAMRGSCAATVTTPKALSTTTPRPFGLTRSTPHFIAKEAARLDHADHDSAIADFSEALRLDPKNTAALIGRGACRLAKSEPYKAIADLSEAIWQNPLSISAYLERGLAWDSLGEHEKAIIDYNLVLRLDSRHAVAYCRRGAARAALRNHSKALADYNEAVRLDPDCASPTTAARGCWPRAPTPRSATANKPWRRPPKLASSAAIEIPGCSAHSPPPVPRQATSSEPWNGKPKQPRSSRVRAIAHKRRRGRRFTERRSPCAMYSVRE